MGSFNVSGTSEKSGKINSFLWILLQSLCHGVIIAITFCVGWFSFYQNYSLFSFHPTFFAIGFLLFFTEGFLIFLPKNVMTKALSRQMVVKIHIALQFLGFAFTIAGFVIIVVNKFNNNFSHFVSPHSITGLVAVILTTITYLGGIMTRLKTPFLAKIKIGHNALGLVAYAVGISAFCLGLLARFPRYMEEGWVIVMVVLTSLVAAVTFFNAAFGLYKRVKNL